MQIKMNSYAQSLEYLYGLQKYGIKFGLSKTSNLLDALGNPHHGRRYIHIAGTNGKGSVGSMLESILSQSGLKVGFYSSPHLVRFTERFRINGREMPPEKAADLTAEIQAIIHPEHPPTFFEAVTAMALVYFEREMVDVAIMEVGMGGRLDATNVIMPMVSVITNISLEHREFLGSRLIDIAGEKAGIIKEGVDLVTAATQPHVISLFQRRCEENHAPFWRVGKDVRYRGRGSKLDYYGFKRTFRGLDLNLAGEFQHRNASTTLAVIELLEKKGIVISSRDIVEGLRNASWPGRMHIVSKQPWIILDGAHNPGSIHELTKTIRNQIPYQRLILVIGIMADKDTSKILRIIVPSASHVIYTKPDYYRSALPERLMREASALGVAGETLPSIPEAIEKAKKMAHPDDLILVSGSLFTIGEALTYFDSIKYKPDAF